MLNLRLTRFIAEVLALFSS